MSNTGRPTNVEPQCADAQERPSPTAPTFWFAEFGFENSVEPCICMDNPTGGDPIIIARLQRGGIWKTYVNAMCDAATRCFRMAEELSEALAAKAHTTTRSEPGEHILASEDASRAAQVERASSRAKTINTKEEGDA